MRRVTRLCAALAVAVVISVSGGVAFAALGGAPKPTSATGANLQGGLVGWWKFDGNATDSSPSKANGTFTGTPSTVADRFGNPGKALSFSGSQWVNYGNKPAWNNSSLTFASWVYNGNNSSIKNIIAKESNYKVRLSGTRLDLLVGATGTGWTLNTGWGVVPVNTWTHIAVTVDSTSGTATAYINGVNVGSTPLTPITAFNGSMLYAAAHNGTGTEPMIGALDDLRFYNRALTASDVTALYNYVDQKPDTVLKAATGSNGLVGQWNFDGNSKDSSPNANNGTATSTSYGLDRKGTANGAMAFTGAPSRVLAPHSSSLDQTGAMTISAWIKPASITGFTNNFATLVSKRTGSEVLPYGLMLGNNGALSADWRVSAGGDVNGYTTISVGNVVPVNTWTHVAYTRTATQTFLYVNGSAVKTANNGFTVAPPVTNTLPLNIGGATTQYSGFTGSMDDVRIYNRALSQQELVTQFSQYKSQLAVGNLQSGLVGSWNMNGNAKDATPNASNCVLAGAPAPTADRKGRASSAYSFNGSSDLQCGTSPALQTPTAVTMSAWVYSDNWDPTGTASHNGVINYGSGGYWLFVRPDGRPAMYIQDGSGHTDGPTAPTVLPISTWSHIVGTFDGVALNLYVNGVLVSSSPATANSISNYGGGTGFEIGSVKRMAGRYFNGKIDDVRIWNRALTAAEVKQVASEYR